MIRNLFLPAGMLAGAIIGAGVFSLPFVLRPLGTLGAAFYLVVLGAMFALVHVTYADLVLRTSGHSNFVSITRHYLGRPGFVLTLLTGVLQMFFVLLIYLTLSKSFFALVMPHELFFGVAGFWLLGSAAIFLNVRRFAGIELLITIGIAAIMGFVFMRGFQSDGDMLIPLTSPFPFSFALLAIGPVLFSLAGRVAVAEVVAYFKTQRKIFSGHERRLPLSFDEESNTASTVRRSIIAGTLFPAALYFLFVLAVWALAPSVTHDAVTGLRDVLDVWSLRLIGVLGLLSLWSSYIIVGLNVKNILRDDLRFPRFLAGALIVIIPPALYGAGFTNFLKLVEFTGGTFLAIEGMLLIYLWQRANRESDPVLIPRVPGIVLVPLYAVFALAFLSVLY